MGLDDTLKKRKERRWK